MKHILSLIVAVMFVGQAWAATTFTVDGLKYTITDEANHYVSVGKGSTNPTGALNIQKKVTNPNDGLEYSVTSIGSDAFRGCSGLTSVTIPNSVTSIGSDAFNGCSSLTSVTIPNSVTSIGNQAFFRCRSLTFITIPESVTSIGNRAFCYCVKLAVILESSNSAYTSENGVLFNKTKTNLIFYPASKTETTYTIPNSVTSIEASAFDNCKNLIEVAIPNSVTNIGDGVFNGCESLTSVTIPESVTSIGSYAFYCCSRLTAICYEGYCEPIYQSNSFMSVNKTIPVCVPADYSSDKWCGFTNLIKGHNRVTDNAVAATCTTTGLTEGSHCSYCGKVLIEQEEIAALDHNYGTPTYTWSADGKTCSAKTVCSRNASHVVAQDGTISSAVTTVATCDGMGTTTYTATFTNNKFTTQTKEVVDVAALGHTPNIIALENPVAATCTTVGSYDSVVYCSVCQAELFREGKESPALGHSYSNTVTTPTCAAVGYTTHTCSVCEHTYYSDTVAANGHTYSSTVTAPTCTAVGFTTHTCSVCEYTYNSDTIDAKGHTYSSTITAPTCTEVGYTTHTCSVCDYTYNSDTVAANGHTYSSTVTAPTCAAVGYTTHTCSVCEYTYNSDTVDAKGHKADSVEFENIIPATCTVAGSKDSVVYCSVCQNELLRETKEIPATGHTEVADAAVAATCTATGKTEDKHCSVCNETIVAQTEIPALGHEFKNYVYNNDATTTADGTETATCERGCGATDTRTAAGTKLAETPEKGTAVSYAAASTLNIYAHHNIIVVENATDEISVYNAMGTLIRRDATPCVRTEINVNVSGVYIVKVGSTAKRVMVNQ